MIWKYPQEVEDLVREWAPKLRDAELAALVNERLGTDFNASRMKGFRGNHGIRNYQPKTYKGEEYWKHQTRWPQGMYEYIRDNSWGVSSAEMARRVNERFGTSWTEVGMKQFRQRHGIKSGVTGWYQKGRSPANKGKKLAELVKDPDKMARIRSTQFKKGERPVNELPVGAVVINSEGYKLRKRQMTGTLWQRWEFLHQAVWREHFGPVPRGMCISFRDGDRSNCDISNLMLITREESAALTGFGFRSGDPELTDAGLMNIRLREAIKAKRGPVNPQGPELMAERERRGITRRQVADAIGVSPQTVVRIEKGGCKTDAASMRAYLALMGKNEERREVYGTHDYVWREHHEAEA